MSDTDIEIILSSDSDYEELTAEIIYKGKFVALLSQDDGIEKCKVEFPSADCEDSLVHRKLELDVLEKGLAMAKQKLMR